MTQITLKPIRQQTTVTLLATLTDNGVKIDWSDLSVVKAYIYSESQRVVAGPCTVQVDGEDPTILRCVYDASKPQYLGTQKLVIYCEYSGQKNTYDKEAFVFVASTAATVDDGTTISEDTTDVDITVEDVSSSILSGAIKAALDAAEFANETAESVQERADQDHTRAEEDHSTAASDHTRAAADHTVAAADHTQAAADHSLASADHLQAGLDHTQASADHGVAVSDHGQAGQDHTRAESDHDTAASDHTKAGQDHTRAESDHTQAAADHTLAGTDHSTAAADHTQAASDHTAAAADHTLAAADHSTAAADHTQALADHQVMQGYDTRLTNVEGEVSQLGQELTVLFSDTYSNNGYIGTNGNIYGTSSDQFKCTPFILIDRSIDIEITHIKIETTALELAFYDKDKVFISGIAGTGAVHNRIVPKSDIPSNAAYIRSSSYSSEINDSTTIKCCSLNGVAKVIGDVIYPAIDKIDEQGNEIDGIKKVCYFNKDIYSNNGYIDTSGNITGTSSDTFKYTPFILIDKKVDIKITHLSGESGLLEVAFYDKDKNFISGITGSSSVHNREVAIQSIPSDAMFIRSSAYASTLTNDTMIQAITLGGLDILAQDSVSFVSEINNSFKEQGTNIYTLNGKYIQASNGKVYNFDGFRTSELIFVNKDHGITINGIGGWTATAAIAFYDGSGEYIDNSSIAFSNRENEGVSVAKNNIPANAVYFRTCCKTDMSEDLSNIYLVNDSFKDFLDRTGRLNTDYIIQLDTLTSVFDYNAARALPRNVLRSIIEASSNGAVTVIWDNAGYPSLMYKIPLVSIGAFSSELGNTETPHPAFYVDGVLKSVIYAGVFMTSYVDGHPVNWFGLAPENNKSFEAHKTAALAKGSGWHLETVYERSLTYLLSSKFNGLTPRCNSNYGMSSVSGYEFETVQRMDGKLAGEQTFGAKWINGTQPLSWSHNTSRWGIYDLIGGLWKWNDLVKIVNGQIYLATDNNFNSEESSWEATGAYINIVGQYELNFNNQYADGGNTLAQQSWVNVLCQAGYDNLPIAMRKKLALLLLVPRISSTDASPLFAFKGVIWGKTDGTYYAMAGGSQEYSNSGFGHSLLSYLKTDNHGNMGARLFYIE